MAAQGPPIRASCHCGAITLTVPRVPDHINHCQCTICRRYGAAWGYYHPDEVKIEIKPGAVTKQCYWWPLRPSRADEGEEYKMGLNTNNVDPELLRFVDRKIEYSILRIPLRSGGTAHPEDCAAYA